LTILAGVAALGVVSDGVTASAPVLQLTAVNRARLADRSVTLAGVVSTSCPPETFRDVASSLDGSRARFVAFPDATGDTGVIVLDDGRNVNELMLATPCAGFDASTLPAGHAYTTGMEQAWRRARERSGTSGWTILAKWTGSGGTTTPPIIVPPGELRVVTLAVPNGRPTSQLQIAVLDRNGAALGRFSTGPLAAKHMATTSVTIGTETTVQIEISGTDVFWGVWAQVAK
jgi:hypothetical protein